MITLAWLTADVVRRKNTTLIYTVRFKVNSSTHDKQLKHFRREGGGEALSSFRLFLGYEDKKQHLKIT
jgi:hypothetical protein